MASISIIEAQLEHLSSMVELLQHLFAQEREFTPNSAQQTAALALILSHPQSGRLFVAIRGGDVLGMVSLLFTISTAGGGYAAWLEDLVVDPRVRSQGVGGALLDHVISWARTQGFVRLSLLTDGDNERAQDLYVRRGFTKSQMLPLRLQLR